MQRRRKHALRIGDDEREETSLALREHAARGRLSVEELESRIEQAYAARTVGELATVLQDLPSVRRIRPLRVRRPRGLALTIGAGALLAGAVEWFASAPGAFWPAWTWPAWIAAAVALLVRRVRRGRRAR